MTADLPLPDYDDLTTQGIGHRIRQLDRSGVEVLVAYEATHANRPAVVLLMRVRLAELEAGAKPSGGSPGAWAPEAGTPGGAPHSTITEGPPVNPPSQGAPENPAQPRH